MEASIQYVPDFVDRSFSKPSNNPEDQGRFYDAALEMIGVPDHTKTAPTTNIG